MESTARIPTCVTLPPGLRDRMDAAATAMERPRSWIATKAIEQFLDRLSPDPNSLAVSAPPADRAAALVREAGTLAAGGFESLPPAANKTARRTGLGMVVSHQLGVIARTRATDQAKAEAQTAARDDVARRNAEYFSPRQGDDP